MKSVFDKSNRMTLSSLTNVIRGCDGWPESSWRDDRGGRQPLPKEGEVSVFICTKGDAGVLINKSLLLKMFDGKF